MAMSYTFWELQAGIERLEISRNSTMFYFEHDYAALEAELEKCRNNCPPIEYCNECGSKKALQFELEQVRAERAKLLDNIEEIMSDGECLSQQLAAAKQEIERLEAKDAPSTVQYGGYFFVYVSPQSTCPQCGQPNHGTSACRI